MKNMLLAALAMFLSFSAFAFEDTPVDLDGKTMIITDVKERGSDRKIDPAGLPNGVYIKVTQDYAGDRLPNAEKLISNMLQSRGLKIAEKPEESDVQLHMMVSGKINSRSIEAGLAAGGPSLKGALSTASAMAAGVSAAGMAGGVGALLGSFFPEDEKSTVSANVILKPQWGSSWIAGKIIESGVKDGQYNINTDYNYRFSSKAEERPAENKVFEFFASQVLDRTFGAQPSTVAAN